MIQQGKINLCVRCFEKGGYTRSDRRWENMQTVPRLYMGAGLQDYPCHICSVRETYQKWCPLEPVEFIARDDKLGDNVLAI